MVQRVGVGIRLTRSELVWVWVGVWLMMRVMRMRWEWVLLLIRMPRWILRHRHHPLIDPFRQCAPTCRTRIGVRVRIWVMTKHLS